MKDERKTLLSPKQGNVLFRIPHPFLKLGVISI